jgi:hypothetical protein
LFRAAPGHRRVTTYVHVWASGIWYRRQGRTPALCVCFLLLLLRHSAVRIIMGWFKMHNRGESSSCKNPSKGNGLNLLRMQT